jgi:uncharacterized membrane protein
MSTTQNENDRRICSICGKSFAASRVVPSATIRAPVAELIHEEHPEWVPKGFVCREDLNLVRQRYVRGLLQSERGDLSALEHEVVRSLQDHELLTRNVDAQMEGDWSRGQRVADRVASFGGSWPFLGIFAGFLVTWIVANSVALLWRPVDPYPFILLNLVLSCLAAVQAPVIMMSQNRQQAKDRLRAKSDYQVNLKAELEIRHLHEKVDHLLMQQWERLAEIQEIQLELLEEISKRR